MATGIEPTTFLPGGQSPNRYIATSEVNHEKMFLLSNFLKVRQKSYVFLLFPFGQYLSKFTINFVMDKYSPQNFQIILGGGWGLVFSFCWNTQCS